MSFKFGAMLVPGFPKFQCPATQALIYIGKQVWLWGSCMDAGRMDKKISGAYSGSSGSAVILPQLSNQLTIGIIICIL